VIQRSSHCGEPSIGTLLKDLSDETRTLLRQEVELAKAEISEKVSVMGRNVAYIAIGGLVALVGLLPIVAAACIGMIVLLDNFMNDSIAAWLGPLIVGVVLGLIGYALIQKALSTLKRESFVPRKTMNSLRENTEWLKDHMTNSENRMTRPSATIH
jgi:xanthine/uracil permease